MKSEELRLKQAPLKAQYKENPSSAMVVLRARGRVSQESITCTLESGKPGVPAGLHPAAGGDGEAACSGDMLLEALVGCAGVTLASVATAMGVVLTSATVSAEGDIDFRGTLGVSRDVPVGFSKIRLVFSIQAETPPETLKKMVEVTERYCVVLQTITKAPIIETRIESIET
jgi:uncharacterized OsmC-like protein